jgi:hypothetical protein
VGSFRPCLPCVRGPGAELATIRCASKCLCCFFLRLTRPVRPLGSFPSSLRPSPCTSPPLAVADLPADNRRGGFATMRIPTAHAFFCILISSLLFLLSLLGLFERVHNYQPHLCAPACSMACCTCIPVSAGALTASGYSGCIAAPLPRR